MNEDYEPGIYEFVHPVKGKYGYIRKFDKCWYVGWEHMDGALKAVDQLDADDWFFTEARGFVPVLVADLRGNPISAALKLTQGELF